MLLLLLLLLLLLRLLLLRIVVVQGASGASVVWKKRRPNIPSEIASTDFVCLAFSADNKSLLTLGGNPDYTMTLWQWEKGRAVSSVRVSNAQAAQVYQCSFAPGDSSFVAVTGNGVFKFLRIDPQSGEFKTIPSSIGKRDPQNYLCHAVLSMLCLSPRLRFNLSLLHP